MGNKKGTTNHPWRIGADEKDSCGDRQKGLPQKGQKAEDEKTSEATRHSESRRVIKK